jgi:hypothetical protein
MSGLKNKKEENMKKIILLTLICLSSSVLASAQSAFGDSYVMQSLRDRALGEALRKMRESGDKPEDFLPPHWEIVKKAEGDLNKDGRMDYVFEMGVNEEPKDAEGNKYLESLRKINDDDGWISGVGALVVVDSRVDGKLHFSTLNSNLTGADGMEIKKGVLILKYNTGGTYHTDATYRFRQQEPTLNLMLIGFDVEHYCEGCGDASAKYETSDNYLTLTRIETTYKMVRGQLVPMIKTRNIMPLKIEFSDARFNDSVFQGKEITPF